MGYHVGQGTRNKATSICTCGHGVRDHHESGNRACTLCPCGSLQRANAGRQQPTLDSREEPQPQKSL